MNDKKIEYKYFSNAELKIKMKELENEYEAVKRKIVDNVTLLDELDKKYNDVKSVYLKRTKGGII